MPNKESWLRIGLVALCAILLFKVADLWVQNRFLVNMGQYDSELVEISPGLYEKLADLRTSKQLNRALKDSNEEMASRIADLHGEIESITGTVIEAPAETLTVAHTDTVVIFGNTGIREYRFDRNAYTATVRADTLHSLTVEPKPISLTTAIYSRPDGSIWADTRISPDFWNIASQTIDVKLDTPGWWEKNRLWILPVAAVVAWEYVR